MSIAASGAMQPCAGASTAPALDHVILVVRDLDAAASSFERHGFRIKPGRLHPNNLLNKHVKFRDGSSIELMTVKGRPGDGMARGYAQMLATGEGGVYLALKAESVEPIRKAATAARLPLRERPYGPWTFLSFPSSPASAVFLTTGDAAVSDPESLVAHGTDVTGLGEVWVEAGPAFAEFLLTLGARECGAAPRSDGPPGRRLGLRRGSVVVVPPVANRPMRLLGAVLELRAGGSPAKIYPHPSFWVRFR